MEPDFWRERWSEGRTAWDQHAAHPTLTDRWPMLDLPADTRVLVPLCGASIDMVWLAARGHRVVGTELSELAVRTFFERAEFASAERSTGAFTVFTGGPYELWCGDHFDLPAEAVRDVAAVYARASLVALPPDTRRRYVEHMADILAPGTLVFLLTFVYDQAEMDGPPFSVGGAEVRDLFGRAFAIEQTSDADIFERSAELAARGVTGLHEELHVLRRRT